MKMFSKLWTILKEGFDTITGTHAKSIITTIIGALLILAVYDAICFMLHSKYTGKVYYFLFFVCWIATVILISLWCNLVRNKGFWGRYARNAKWWK